MVSEVRAPSAHADVRTHSVASFSAALRALRRQAGEPTLVALSARTGVSKTVLSDALSGRALPSERTVFHLVRALGGESESWLAQRDALDPRRSMLPSTTLALEAVAPISEPISEPISAEQPVPEFGLRFWQQHPGIIVAASAVSSAIVTSMAWGLLEAGR